MVAGKQFDVVTAGLIVGNADSHRVLGNHFICARRGHCGSWQASDQDLNSVTGPNS